MRYLKHIYEMEEWATSNKLSDQYDKVGDFIKQYPIVVNNGHISVQKFDIAVLELLKKMNLTKDDLLKLVGMAKRREVKWETHLLRVVSTELNNRGFYGTH